MTRISLEALNAADPAAFVQAIADVFEHSPWIAERAAAQRPFATVESLHAAMWAEIASAAASTQQAFVSLHPELAGRAASEGEMTMDSVSEQGSTGLDRLSPAEVERFTRLNRDYRARFALPFVICVRRHTRASILSEFEHRLASTQQDELAAALREIFYITRLRVDDRVDGAGRPRVHGHLSTHVLDTLAGRPAAGVRLELRDISDGFPGVLMKQETTNADGRTERALIGGQPLRIGRYELTFHLAEYYRGCGVALPTPAFLDEVPLRFAISEPEGNYHVPLLATPWSYSTYRGS
ncbi:MAG TPA: 2-oxo-4-hydroxy-4-carboxy-5-ureidoimidazoline decarboxylase [Xanthobacteraceae bacterium]|nr:2-oxo-4-hydroxy-4-carboxy-5-ureidoimidazoline decarboxylase [Xanthobacteraceae bacterium]